MNSEFDPYYKWLGIPPRSQPPHHYRLLAIELFEDDRDVVEAAAERLMTYLKLAANGEHVEHSQKLLNEVAVARRCLLNPEKKAAYDARLRQQLAKSDRRATAAATANPPELPTVVEETPLGPAEQELSRKLVRPSRRKRLLALAIGGTALAAAVTLAAVLWGRGRPDARPVAQAAVDGAPATVAHAVAQPAGPSLKAPEVRPTPKPQEPAPPAPVATAKVATPPVPPKNPAPPVGQPPPAVLPPDDDKPPVTVPLVPLMPGLSLDDKPDPGRGPFAPESKSPTKPDEPKPSEPLPDQPKPSEPKPDASKPDEPKPGEVKPAEAKPEEPKLDARTAQHEVQTLLRSKQTDDRVRAMQLLKDLPPLEAAKLAVQPGMDDRAPEVRKAAYQAVLAVKDQHEAADYLMKIVIKQGHSKPTAAGNPPALAPLIMALSSSSQAGVQRDLEKFVTWYLAASKPHITTLLTVADELGRQADPAAVTTLRGLSAWSQFNDLFAFRRAVVDALIHCRQIDAIDALIGLMGHVDGEVEGDMVQYLTDLTKMPYGNEVDAWKLWWQKRKATFSFDPPPPGAAAPEVVIVPQAPGSYSSYYGLPVRARRVVFVVDISGSMRGPRLEMAKRELAAVVNKLPAKDFFSIMIFDHQVAYWRKELVAATPGNKDAAMQYISYLQARGMTATYDALDAASNFDAEAIYFLTDGEPTCGRVINPAQITVLVTKANFARRLSIYTIGISPGPAGGIFDVFLKALATQNYGRYQRVEQ